MLQHTQGKTGREQGGPTIVRAWRPALEETELPGLGKENVRGSKSEEVEKKQSMREEETEAQVNLSSGKGGSLWGTGAGRVLCRQGDEPVAACLEF
jgi:hypothetical protein